MKEVSLETLVGFLRKYIEKCRVVSLEESLFEFLQKSLEISVKKYFHEKLLVESFKESLKKSKEPLEDFLKLSIAIQEPEILKEYLK